MKLLLLGAALIAMAATTKNCRNKETFEPGCFKGRLEVKGGCMNYTIALTGGDLDSTLFVPAWTDESTGKNYKNVFALGSRCNFPDTLNAGDEFYFKIDSTTVQNCSVCMMYYPVPPKKLSIKVLNGPCSK